MRTVTLDTNCLIDIENKFVDTTQGYDYRHIEDLLSHHGKDLNIAVVAASASDVMIDGERVTNINDFFRWLKMIGVPEIEVLKPIGYWGIAFWDWCLWSDEPLKKLDKQLHNLLFPTLPVENPTQDSERKWRNAKHDVLIMWAHVWNRREVFVTRDKNFLRKAKELKILGAGEILRPDDALSFLGITIRNGILRR